MLDRQVIPAREFAILAPCGDGCPERRMAVVLDFRLEWTTSIEE